MTQEELALATGKHRATIVRLEGGNPISEGTLHAIADIVKIDYSILTGEPDTLRSNAPPSENQQALPEKPEGPMLTQTKELARLIGTWSGKNISNLTFGEVGSAIDHARRILETIETIEDSEVPSPFAANPGPQQSSEGSGEGTVAGG
jgi:hypothetical protein